MRVNEIAKDRSCTAIEKDPLHLLLLTSPDSDPARPALLCLMWEVRKRGLDVGLSTEVGHAPEQIWRTAAERNVDLIVLPESLFGSFRPVVSRSDTFEAVQGAPCPILVVAA